MNDRREFYWFLLSNTPGFGPKSIHYINKTLREINKTIKDLFELEINDLQRLFPKIGHGVFSSTNFTFLHQLDYIRFYQLFEKIISDGVTLIALDDERYPQSVLKNMGDNAPPILYCKGNLSLLNQTGIAIVGSRNSSDIEISLTKKIAKTLAEKGFNIISGYAKGVDTAAHSGALLANGTTTIILSFGTNHIKIKKELKGLLSNQNTLFVSQFAPNDKFSGRNAMTRNKLVCAMSKAVVVIKSGPEKDNYGRMSGTFNAGKAALKMGITCFVLKPDVLNTPAPGNLDLIKLGGIEFSSVMQILNFLKS